MLEKLTLQIAADQVQTNFRVRLDDAHAVDVRLQTATDAGSTPRQEQFSLLFTGPLDLFLPQGIYRLEHDQLGTIDLFLVPIGKDGDGYQYEAVFNRLLS